MNIKQLKSIQQNVATQGGHHLGTLLWWSLAGNNIDHLDLQDLAKQHGLDERYLPRPIKAATAFRRAWRHANTNNGEGVMLRQITDDENAIVIGVVEETTDTVNLDLDYTTPARIHFNKITDSIYIYGGHPVVAKVQELFKRHEAHTTEDIRAILTGFVRIGGIALRETGGVYFVPSSCQTTLDAVAAVVQAAGSNAVHQLPIYDAPQVRSTLTNVARTSLDEEIKALQKELDGFDDKTRQSTLDRRLTRFDELRSRVQLFAGVLSFKADDLKNKLTTANNELRAKLGLDNPASEDESKTQDQLPLLREVVRDSGSWTPEEAIGF